MSTIDYSKLEKALARLIEQQREYEASFDDRSLRPSSIDAYKESVIHRFEVCHDMLWKHLRKHLQIVTGLAEVPASPNAVFRLAAEHGIIDDYTFWHQYTQLRNNTSHDYDGNKAEQTLAIVPQYLEDAVALTEKIVGRPWK